MTAAILAFPLARERWSPRVGDLVETLDGDPARVLALARWTRHAQCDVYGRYGAWTGWLAISSLRPMDDAPEDSFTNPPGSAA